MGNFEKLSVLVIVVIIVMILVVALYTWSGSTEGEKGLNSSSDTESFASEGATPRSQAERSSSEDPGWTDVWADEGDEA